MKTDKNTKTIEAYNKNAQFYADMFDSYGTRNADTDRAFKLNESNCSKVLELGCANGRDAGYIVNKVGGTKNYIGVDASGELIKIAKQKSPKIEFQVKQFQDLEFDEGTFGLILSFYSLLHVNHEEMGLILQKCHKWLKIGGILYITGKYGEAREIEIENLGSKKYYYAYKPEDIETLVDKNFTTVYKTIGDSDYGPAFTLALQKKS